ncbi:Altered inheritance of mitochondria protein 1 [Fasciolopsis buskii]|uniref:Altered inheritance of mitochondria protein 1 n=1 Tax=Fasciolopsis buskii TaxID=27845 RepID=A0A8E0VNN6_9TREM|nr:Altered inheritance of mitochondria protein 1 [Fasciolopsis buski]
MNSRHLIGRRLASPLCKWAFSRCYATDGERAIEQILRDRFQAARLIRVADVSGGCGSMYQIEVECDEFRNMSVLAQHRAVKQALEEQIKSMHGLTISTKA